MLYNVLIEPQNEAYATCNSAAAKAYAKQGYAVFLGDKRVTADDIDENADTFTAKAGITKETTKCMKVGGLNDSEHIEL